MQQIFVHRNADGFFRRAKRIIAQLPNSLALLSKFTSARLLAYVFVLFEFFLELAINHTVSIINNE